MMHVVLVALLLVACSSRPQAREPQRAATPWCLRLAYLPTASAEPRQLLACVETKRLCLEGRARLFAIGGMARVEVVGACTEVAHAGR